ncbi:hypothetical protein [Halobellus litoreus]|uniref:Transglutaminase-like superfamily protein n=1 Tax=Halobellus litoreus TaxID=755310 RepID=A0ABD6DWS4_9EURY|nr:hypothetical protein [Halobellus litoreus]
MRLRRWTPLTYLFPNRYVDRDPFWAEFDFEQWSESTYEWTEDPWNGFRDFAQRPAETVSRGTGDCEDYSLVAASWMVAQGREGTGIAFCWEPSRPWPTHVIAFEDGRVYSSGNITEGTLDDWIADSKYLFALKRRVG